MPNSSSLSFKTKASLSSSDALLSLPFFKISKNSIHPQNFTHILQILYIQNIKMNSEKKTKKMPNSSSLFLSKLTLVFRSPSPSLSHFSKFQKTLYILRTSHTSYKPYTYIETNSEKKIKNAKFFISFETKAF
jgi:hypothetical protein